MASESIDTWRSLSIEEAGGFAGLRRGATLDRSGLDERSVAAIGKLLHSVSADRSNRAASRSAPFPDSQTLTLRVHAQGATWEVNFDTADLPGAVSQLARYFPPLRPLPIGN